MYVALNVTNSTDTQLPESTTEQTSGVQQTKNTDGLAAPNSQTTTSAEDQQKLMELLRNESSGPSYESTPTQNTLSAGHIAFGVAGVVVLAVLLVFYYRLFSRKLSSPKIK